MSRSDLRVLVPALALAALVAAPLLVLPPGRDQAIFALVGRIIADGGMPYRDAFDFKPPGVHLVYAIAARFARDPSTVAPALDLLALLAGAVALFVLVRPRGLFAGAVAASYLVLAYALSLRYWDLAQPEAFQSALVLVGLCLGRARSDAQAPPRAAARRAFGAGLAFGVAVLMKYTALFFVPLALLLGRPRALPFAGGLAAPIVAAAAWLALGGALGDFVEIQRAYVPGYTQLVLADGFGTAARASLAIARAFFEARPLLLWPPIVGLLLIAAPWRRAASDRPSPIDRRHAAVPALGIAAAIVAVSVQGKFFHYHWIPILPFLAWASAVGLARAREAAATPRARAAVGTLALLALALLAGLTARTTWSEKRPALAVLLGRSDRAALVAAPAFGVPGRGDHSLVETWRAGREASRLCPPDARVFVWGFEPWLYLVADRSPSSRFIYTAPFTSPWCPRAWTDEIVSSLRRDPPRVFVLSSGDAVPWVTGVPLDSRETLRYFPDIVELLGARYRQAGEIGRFTLFVRTR